MLIVEKEPQLEMARPMGMKRGENRSLLVTFLTQNKYAAKVILFKRHRYLHRDYRDPGAGKESTRTEEQQRLTSSSDRKSPIGCPLGIVKWCPIMYRALNQN